MEEIAIMPVSKNIYEIKETYKLGFFVNRAAAFYKGLSKDCFSIRLLNIYNFFIYLNLSVISINSNGVGSLFFNTI